MSREAFLQELLELIRAFCRILDSAPPAYSYIPLKTDEERVRVMQSRLFNELRAADLFGAWLKSTPELDVKEIMAESAHEEGPHMAASTAEGGEHDEVHGDGIPEAKRASDRTA